MKRILTAVTVLALTPLLLAQDSSDGFVRLNSGRP